MLLRDNAGRANLIHASSIRSRRRARSVLSAEMFAILDGFDVGYVVREILSELLGRKVDFVLLTDSRSAFHITTTLISTKEKRLMLDVHLVREAYENREISKILWISGASNLADCLTKVNHNGTLRQYLLTNSVDISCEGWVDRDIRPVHSVDYSQEEKNAILEEAASRMKEVDILNKAQQKKFEQQ